jgi:hypothetical protein
MKWLPRAKIRRKRRKRKRKGKSNGREKGRRSEGDIAGHTLQWFPRSI